MKKCAFYLLVISCIITLFMDCALKQETTAPEGNYKVAVCDWMILKRQKLGAFQLAREIGSQGLELDMGGLGTRDTFDNKLRHPNFQKLFREAAATNHIEIASIAMSGFYGQSFLKRANYKELFEDCFGTMQAMGVKTAFLPLGTETDLAAYPELRPEAVKRLKVIGAMAAQRGMVVGIETSLDADGEISLLDEINSPGIKIYYNFQNPLEGGRDIYREIRKLGKERICQIHCTDTDGVTLPNNKRLDMKRIRALLDELGWKGWLVVERSRDANEVHNVRKNYGTNVAYLEDVFSCRK